MFFCAPICPLAQCLHGALHIRPEERVGVHLSFWTAWLQLYAPTMHKQGPSSASVHFDPPGFTTGPQQSLRCPAKRVGLSTVGNLFIYSADAQTHIQQSENLNRVQSFGGNAFSTCS